MCHLPELEELFNDKPHLEGMVKGRGWSRVKARIKNNFRNEGNIIDF
jgi:hypothetical protein